MVCVSFVTTVAIFQPVESPRSPKIPSLSTVTGTAVNPLLRAAYLHRRTQEINSASHDDGHKNKRWVTLVIPWLELSEDQETLYGRVFRDAQEQEDFIRAWLRDEAGMGDAADPETGLEILFYPARYHAGLGSIFAMGDIMDTVMMTATSDDNERQLDVCVLEEPEHCNWFRAPSDGWTKRFNYVVGIVHTSKSETFYCWFSIFYLVYLTHKSIFGCRLQGIRKRALLWIVDSPRDRAHVVRDGTSLLSQSDQAV